MRVSTVDLLIVLALAISQYAPIAAASVGANLTLFNDSSCASPLEGSATTFDISSSTACRSDDRGVSLLFYCYDDAGLANLSLSVWTNSSTCDGAVDVGIYSVAEEGTCAPATVVVSSQTSYDFASVLCFDSRNGTAAAERARQTTALTRLASTIASAAVQRTAEARRREGRLAKLMRMLPGLRQ